MQYIDSHALSATILTYSPLKILYEREVLAKKNFLGSASLRQSLYIVPRDPERCGRVETCPLKDLILWSLYILITCMPTIFKQANQMHVVKLMHIFLGGSSEQPDGFNPISI